MGCAYGVPMLTRHRSVEVASRLRRSYPSHWCAWRVCPDRAPRRRFARPRAVHPKESGGTTPFDREDGSFVLRLPGAMDIVVSPELDHVVCEVAEDLPDGVVDIVIPGLLSAFVLRLRGELVLHTSAVAWDGRAVTFTGQSGMGKTTMAAVACAGGAAIVTDDVLRVDRDGDGSKVYTGTVHLRLRKSPKELGLASIGTAMGTSVDGGLTYAPPVSPDVPLALDTRSQCRIATSRSWLWNRYVRPTRSHCCGSSISLGRWSTPAWRCSTSSTSAIW